MATPYTLQRLYSPSKKYGNILTLWDDVDDLNDDEYYKLLIADVILADGDYTEILNLEVPASIENADIIINQEIANYLSHCDDLPIFPSVADCLNQFKAPQEIIDAFVVNYSNATIISLLPRTADDSLTILFEEKLKQFYESVKLKNKNGYYLNKVTLADLQYMFSVLADHREPKADLFEDDILVEELKSYFELELLQIQKYENLLSINSSLEFEKVLNECKLNKLTQIDTVINFLKLFF